MERRIAVNSIGPFWDGNEVWLIVAGAAIFAAFPGWYATMFSTFYLALVVVLVALIIRGVSFEFRRKVGDPRWSPSGGGHSRSGAPWSLCSWGPHSATCSTGSPSTRLTTTPAASSGSSYPSGCSRDHAHSRLPLSRVYLPRTQDTGELHDRISLLSGRIGWIAAVLVWIFVDLEPSRAGQGICPESLGRRGGDGCFRCGMARRRQAGRLGIHRCIPGHWFDGGIDLLRPLPTCDGVDHERAYSLTVANTASPSYTLKVMTVVAIVFFPVVLAYQGWNFWVFRGRIRSPREGASSTTGAGDALPTKSAPSHR